MKNEQLVTKCHELRPNPCVLMLFLCVAPLSQEHRDLQSLRCAPGENGDALYNVVLKVLTNGDTNCRPSQRTQIWNYVTSRFDNIINNDRSFRNNFRLASNFCRPSRRRLDSGSNSSNGTSFEDEELCDDDLLLLDDVEEEDDEEEEESDYYHIVNNSSLGGTTTFDHDTTSAGRQLALRVMVQPSSKGIGACRMCKPDNKDRRRLVDDETYFYRSTDDMEELVERKVSKGLWNQYQYKRGHCLQGRSPRLEVHLLVVGSRGRQTRCNGRQDVYCCAPKHDPTDVCSKSQFGDGWYCHETRGQCQGECGGMWVNAMNPPTCTPFWSECTHGGKCCPGSRCQGNSYYKQCKPN